MFRKYAKTVSLIIVSALLFSGNFAVNVISTRSQKFFDAHPQLYYLLWGLVGFCLLASVYLFIHEYNATPPNVVQATPPTEANPHDRREMLGTMRRIWIDGILRKSLWEEARISLHLEGKPDAVVRPCDLAIRRAGKSDTAIAPGTPIFEVYKKEQGELLLLGEPGSGKTTLLLEIAESLLQEAEHDPAVPIPVVFGLSAWRERDVRLDQWLIQQLVQDYGVPEKVGKRWIEQGRLVLLLDGLDEVAESRRAACVKAINLYRRNHQAVLRPMVVSCRIKEYESIPDLQLNGAVVIHALTESQVNDYLKSGGKLLAGLRAVLQDEPTLYQELFSTPLMLNVAVMTYSDRKAAELRRNVPIEERRRLLWDAYIERMFESKMEGKPKYDTVWALDGLGWLGKYLTRKDLQKYLIEGMQPDDLPSRFQTLLVRVSYAIVESSCAFFLLLYFFSNRIAPALLLTIPWLFICYSRAIVLDTVRQFRPMRLKHQWKTVISKCFVALAMGGVFGTVIGALLKGVTGAIGGSVMGLATGGLFGIAAAIGLTMYEDEVMENTVRPNEGIRHSFKSAGFGTTIRGMSVAVAIGFLIGGTMIFSLLMIVLFTAMSVAIRLGGEVVTGIVSLSIALVTFFVAVGTYGGVRGLSKLILILAAGTLGVMLAKKGEEIRIVIALFALFFFLGTSMVRGGARTVVQHYLLRLLLGRSGRFPYQITPFLDWATERILLQRVGGGWKFVHRTLQERFAERYEAKYSGASVSEV